MTQWAIGAFALFMLLCVLYIIHMRRKIRSKDRELGKHEHRFAASEKRIRTIINAIPDMFFIVDRNGTYLEYSAHDPSLLKSFNGILIGRNLREFFPAAEADRLIAAMESAFVRHERVQIRYELDVIAGIRQFECLIVPLEADTVVWFSRDITQQREREALIQKSLNEKELLLREVHHRVKNNLQVISSLVSLQKAQFENEHDRKLMSDTIFRIQSMAHLHEFLYQSENLESIDVKAYLEDVVDDLLYAFIPDIGRLSVTKNIGALTVCLDAALPLGLILNELVMVSLRFLHPAGSEGSLSIDRHADSGRVILEILNEGPVSPDGISRNESASLGYVLVPALVHQLSGSMTVLSESPGNVRCEFPLSALCESRAK